MPAKKQLQAAVLRMQQKLEQMRRAKIRREYQELLELERQENEKKQTLLCAGRRPRA